MVGVQTNNKQQTTENAKDEASLNLRLAESGAKNRLYKMTFSEKPMAAWQSINSI